MALTLKETKNKVLADMPERERIDALVGQTPEGYLIVTERRVFEIYEIRGKVYVTVKDAPGGWEDYEV